ncbi:hypothetical protein LINPERPRIM_LOCUS12965 [Linum perenne]
MAFFLGEVYSMRVLGGNFVMGSISTQQLTNGCPLTPLMSKPVNKCFPFNHPRYGQPPHQQWALGHSSNLPTSRRAFHSEHTIYPPPEISLRGQTNLAV